MAEHEWADGERRRRSTVDTAADMDRWLFMSDVCKHCTNAGCLDACPTGAIIRTEFETVVVQPDVCNGCGYCIPACPFGVVDRDPYDGRAAKCTLCYDRLEDGLEPACAKACPTDSIQFGPYDELVEIASRRVAALHERGIEGAYLYGAGDAPDEELAGGLGAFFLLTEPPERFGLPAQAESPIQENGDTGDHGRRRSGRARGGRGGRRLHGLEPRRARRRAAAARRGRAMSAPGANGGSRRADPFPAKRDRALRTRSPSATPRPAGRRARATRPRRSARPASRARTSARARARTSPFMDGAGRTRCGPISTNATHVTLPSRPGTAKQSPRPRVARAAGRCPQPSSRT